MRDPRATAPRPDPAPPPAPDAVAALGTILSVWAHPDDETYLAAGVMAAARDHGQRVVCATATAGERGTDDPDTWPPDRLGRVRRWEAAAAMAVLGVREHLVLGLPDGDLAAHEEEGLDWAGRLVDAVAPDTILTFGPDGMTFHPDHLAVHRWVTAAWHRRGRPGRLLHATPTAEHLAAFGDRYEEWGIYMTEQRPTGVPVADVDLHLCLTGPALDRKLAALRAMSTQTAGAIALLGPATYAAQVAEEVFVAAPAAPPG
ncbi:MAG: PIG-L deacetylase family protein [Thermoanaerobacterales bacterium]|jgi:LmbE family N-acetylglucosaminyl deacetylase